MDTDNQFSIQGKGYPLSGVLEKRSEAMTNDQLELKGLILLIDQTKQRAKKYRGSVSDLRAKVQVERVMDALSDAKIGTELTIKELEQ